MTREQFAAVSAALKERWYITAEDAGFGPEEYDLADWDNDPKAFAEWFGEKYDLYDFRDVFGFGRG